jgi:tetratricopeptide (TPR) repeat protein
LLALTLGACTLPRPSAPLDSREDRIAVRATPTATPAVERSEPTLSEEDLPAAVEATPVQGQGAPANPTGGLAVEAPSVLGTITARTAPNVAAATRLADGGRARMAAGDGGGALEALERAIAVDPANPYAYYFLAELHFRHRTYDQAIAFADRAATLSEAGTPEWSSRAYTLQGNAFEAAGRFADARGAYGRALAAAPSNLAAQVGLARVGGPGAVP